MLTPEPYAPYRRPPLTKEYLRGEAAREDLPIESDNWYEENGVELRLLAGVGAIDRERQTVITHKGEELSYDVCVLATGSEPVRPPVPGGDDPEILTMRTVENSTRLQDRVGEGDRAVVVGSGFIGCEAAASLSMRGAAVTLASHEQSPQRRRLGDAVGERIEGWLGDFGVDLRLGVKIEGVERKDGGLPVSRMVTSSIRGPSSSQPAFGPASSSPQRPVWRWTVGSSQTPPCGRARRGSTRSETSPKRTMSPQGATSASNTGATRWSTVASRGWSSRAAKLRGAWRPASGPRSATRDSSTGPGGRLGRAVLRR